MENEVNAAVATQEAEQMAARYAAAAGATREQGGGGGVGAAEVSDEDIARVVEVTMLSLCIRTGMAAMFPLASDLSSVFCYFLSILCICHSIYFLNTLLSLLGCLAYGRLPIFLSGCALLA